MPVRVLISLVVFVLTAVPVSAQSIAVNGAVPPNAVSVGAAQGVAIAVTDGPGNATDWIALFPAGAPNNAYLAWSYLNGAASPPSSGLTSASLTTHARLIAGDYEWRLFANDGFTLLATSSVVTVTASTAALTVNGVVSPSTATVGAGGSITVAVADGPGNPTDWIGLAPAGSPDSTLIDWRYLNGTTVPPSSGLSGGRVNFVAPATPVAMKSGFSPMAVTRKRVYERALIWKPQAHGAFRRGYFPLAAGVIR